MNETKELTFWQKHGTKVKVTLGVSAGVIVGIFVARNGDVVTQGIKTFIQFGDNHNVVITELERRGHPGFIVRDLESGVVAASKRHMMEILDVSHKVLEEMIASGDVIVLGEAK